jgi:hypothetical protein
MTKGHVITGRIIPERKAFGHEGLRLYVKEPDSGIDICVIFGVIDNQLVAKVLGKVGDQSHVTLWNIITQAEQIVLNAEAFTSGRVFEVDLVSLLREDVDKLDGSMSFHYRDNVHDVIADRNAAFDARQVWDLCIMDEGFALRLCLNDLNMALRQQNDAPFYCYRAVEIIKNHIGSRCGGNERQQWEVTRNTLGVEREKLEIIKALADPLRHGRRVTFKGAEWRQVILISWEVTEAYMKLLYDIAAGQRRWPDDAAGG